MNLQELINDIFEENGDFGQSIVVSNDVVDSYKGKLPDLVLEIWNQKGVGSWYKGLYRLCLPSDFSGLLSQIFHADKDFSHKDCHVIAYSAFGNLVIWSEKHWLMEVNLIRNTLACDGLIYPEKKKNDFSQVATEFFMLSEKSSQEAHNFYDEDEKPLFNRARKRLGDLEAGECYGFFPAIPLGGAPNLKNIKRVEALEHFTLLAQLKNFSLIDYLSSPMQVVRDIG